MTYADAAPETLVAIISGSDTVEIAVRAGKYTVCNGNAAAALGVSTGETVVFSPQP